MGKKYADYMDEISADDLYKGLLAFGLFSNKVPPVFSSTPFFDYCVNNNPSFSNDDHDYVRYKTLRNINTPRQLGIPVPMAYEKMCSVLKNYWSYIQTHFHTYTDSQAYIISRIHIQKRKNKDEYVFKAFDTPEDEIQKFIDLAYEDGMEKRNYEECGYAIYFALKYNMDVKSIDSSKVAATSDCVYKLLSYLYFKKKGDSAAIIFLQNDARNLVQTDCDLDRNWLFVYETLDQQDLVGEWVAMKRHGVSFLKNEFRY